MNRIQIDVITGQREVIELNAEEVAQAQAMYAQWEADEAKRKAELPTIIAKQIADLQAQLDALKA
jgi:mannitol/fructose-specific phosphotransferase system IIA component (Ntr-type)